MHIIDVVSINNPNFANWIPLQNNEDTKGVIRSRKSKKDIQYNDKEDDLQNITQITRDRATPTPLKPRIKINQTTETASSV
jgi:hypothetical protein